jgi:hypothetical protein
MTGCRALRADSPAPDPPNARREAPQQESWHAPSGTQSILSNGGAWRIAYRTDPTPPERGTLFSVEAWVCATAEPDRLRQDVTLVIDAAMPQHQHGMSRVPTIAPTESGSFRSQGLLFHMAGDWELYFDVTQGAVTERAQVEIDVE